MTRKLEELFGLEHHDPILNTQDANWDLQKQDIDTEETSIEKTKHEIQELKTKTDIGGK